MTLREAIAVVSREPLDTVSQVGPPMLDNVRRWRRDTPHRFVELCALMGVDGEPPQAGESESRQLLHLEALERRTIERALATHRFSQAAAARALGISARALNYKMTRHGIPRRHDS